MGYRNISSKSPIMVELEDLRPGAPQQRAVWVRDSSSLRRAVCVQGWTLCWRPLILKSW